MNGGLNAVTTSSVRSARYRGAMRIIWLTLSLSLAGCGAHATIADRFDSVDQQLDGLRERLHMQEQMIAELKAMIGAKPIK